MATGKKKAKRREARVQALLKARQIPWTAATVTKGQAHHGKRTA